MTTDLRSGPNDGVISNIFVQKLKDSDFGLRSKNFWDIRFDVLQIKQTLMVCALPVLYSFRAVQ